MAQVVVYKLSVYATRAILPEEDETFEDVTREMLSRSAKYDLEKEVVRALKKLDGDFDCECMDVSIEEEA